jgi:transcriptional regulator with XRE-family HTH domain
MSAEHDDSGDLEWRVDLKALGRRFFQARTKHRLHQLDVVRRAGLSSRYRLSRIERGHCHPSLEEVIALTRVLEMDLVEAVLGKSRAGGPLHETARLLEELGPADQVASLNRLLGSLLESYRQAIAEGMRR